MPEILIQCSACRTIRQGKNFSGVGGIDSVSLRKGLIVFVLLAFGVNAVVLATSVDQQTISRIASANKLGILFALFSVICAWLCDGFRFIAIGKAAGEILSFKLGMTLTFLHYFGCAVTPMQSGGGPFQVYVLYKKKVPIGKGIAITLTRTLMTLLLLGLTVPVAVMLEPGILEGSMFLKGIFSYVIVFVVVSWFFVVLSILRPRVIKRWSQILILWLKRFGFVKPTKVLAVVRRINREIDNYNDNFHMFFTTGLPQFLWAICLSALYLFFLFSVLPCLIWSIGLPVNYLQTLMVQGVFLFVLYFIPTPGASGVAEGGGAALFHLLVPWNLAGVMAITWRFFTEYIGIAIGVAVAIRLLGWGISEEIYRADSEQDKM